MRILLISHEFPPLGGGAGNTTFYTAREMAKMGHSVLVLTAWFTGLQEHENMEGFDVWRVKSRRKRMDGSNPMEMVSFIFAAIGKMPGIVADFQPEKIIAFFGIPSGMVAYWAFKKFSIPYIITLRGGDVPRFVGDPLWFDFRLRVYHRLTRFMTHKIWQNAKHVIAIGRGLQQSAQKTGTKIGVDVGYVPNGVDCDRYYPDKSRRNRDGVKILFVGRLSKEKGLKYLLEAVSLIRDVFTDYSATVELIGDGPMHEELEDVADRLAIRKLINFSGWTKKESLPLKYQSADIFAFPSLDEGMPNALLEALASGMAVVATNIEANKGLVVDGSNGFLVRPRDVDKLAEKLKELIINDDVRSYFGEQSRNIAKNFSWKNVALKYI